MGSDKTACNSIPELFLNIKPDQHDVYNLLVIDSNQYADHDTINR